MCEYFRKCAILYPVSTYRDDLACSCVGLISVTIYTQGSTINHLGGLVVRISANEFFFFRRPSEQIFFFAVPPNDFFFRFAPCPPPGVLWSSPYQYSRNLFVRYSVTASPGQTIGPTPDLLGVQTDEQQTDRPGNVMFVTIPFGLRPSDCVDPWLKLGSGPTWTQSVGSIP